MRRMRRRGGDGRLRRGNRIVRLLAGGVLAGQMAAAQTCTTQGKMSVQQRAEVGTAAYTLAAAVAAGDTARIQAGAVAHYAGDMNQTTYLVRSTAGRIAGDQLTVTQLYLLDASHRAAGDNNPAEFTCALTGTVSETDFGISGLPPGRFAFAMVEAQGPHPWLLAFLLQQEGGAWKMAGFYPHARTAGGHDGLWYWTTARQDAGANKPWLAWVMYGEAGQLLRPAAFVSSGNLERLLTEQRTAAPQPLADGISRQAPLTVQGSGGAVYSVTSLGAEAPTGEAQVSLTMHIEVQGAPLASEAATERNLAAGRALLLAHPELRETFTSLWVIADGTGGTPFVVQRPIQELMAGADAR